MQLMDQRKVKNGLSHPVPFVEISDEKLEAYKLRAYPSPGTHAIEQFGRILELRRIPIHFHTNGRLSGDQYPGPQLKA